MNIPKIIHYVWVGGKPIPKEIQKLIDNNSKILGSEWKTKIWTEKNFDINSHPFTSYWYNKGNWAYVSDYIRAYAVFNDGGFYIDTDIEIKKSFDPLLKNNVILSYTDGKWLTASSFGAIKHSPVIKQYMDMYSNEYIKKHQKKIMSSDIMTFVAHKNPSIKILDSKYLQLDIDGNGYSVHHHHDNWKGKKNNPKQSKYYSKKINNYLAKKDNSKEIQKKMEFIRKKVGKSC